MGITVNIILIAVLVLGALLGMKRGLIKTAVSLLGTVTIIIISWSLHTPLSNFLIDTLPLFSFAGTLAGLTSITILVYNAIAFVVVFVLLYCVLNIVISITGFIDTLLKFTVIWIVPSKIGGAIIGLIETWVFAYLVLFVLSQFSLTQSIVSSSAVSNFMLDHTPIVGNMLGGARVAAKEIYSGIEEYTKDDSKTIDDLNLYILQIEIGYGLVTKERATELIQTGKIDLQNVLFGKADSLWKQLNI